MVGIYICIGILVFLFALNLISLFKSREFTSALAEIEFSREELKDFKKIKRELLSGKLRKLTNRIKLMQKRSVKFALSIRYKDVQNIIAEHVEALDQTLNYYIFDIAEMQRLEKDVAKKNIQKLAELVDGNRFKLYINVLAEKDKGHNRILKKVFQESKEIGSWSDLQSHQSIEKNTNKDELGSYAEYLFLLLYYHVDEKSFQVKLQESLSHLFEKDGDEFFRKVFKVDKHLDVDGHFFELIKSFIGSEFARKSKERQAMEEEELDTDNLDLEISSKRLDNEVEDEDEPEVEKGEHVISGADFTFPFEELNSWKSYIEEFDKTPLDAIGGLLGDSSMILRKKYQLAIIECTSNPDLSDDGSQMGEIEAAWDVIEDIRSEGFIN